MLAAFLCMAACAPKEAHLPRNNDSGVNTTAFDQLFLGVTGYERGRGFTCGLDDQAVFKRALIGQSDECIALMDSGKEGRHSTFPICPLSRVNTVVSDGGLSAEFLADCAAGQVTVL